jgi:heavy metal sensor kinase
VNRWWRSHSVRVRLTLWYVAAMIVVLAIYAFVVYVFVSRNASETLNARLRGDFQWASAMVEQTPEGGITWYEDINEEESFWLQVWSPDGELLYQNSEAVASALDGSRDLALTGSGGIAVLPHPIAPVRVLTQRGTIGLTPVIIQVGRSELVMQEGLAQVGLILALGLPLAVAVAGLGGYTLARRALLPIERMTDRAQHITAERLSDRLPVDNPDDEMGRLATVFNETLGRLEASFEQMRRFTSDVSHQLRTPLTSMRSVGEVGLREHRDDATYRTIIGSMLEETDRLASLVDRLLTLSRAETRQATLMPEDLDVGELAAEVAAHLEVLAEEREQTLGVECAGASHAYVDRFVVRQALINLVDNAIKFTPRGGQIRIRVDEREDHVLIDVIDSGAGIDPAARDHVFDRFYRAPNAETAGTGLGLSIAKGALEAAGGRLTLESSGPGGSTFRMALPKGKSEVRSQKSEVRNFKQGSQAGRAAL